jgi:hypothetical protein
MNHAFAALSAMTFSNGRNEVGNKTKRLSIALLHFYRNNILNCVEGK